MCISIIFNLKTYEVFTLFYLYSDPLIIYVLSQVSQTRLEARTHRPDVELCRDPPFHRLVEEVGQITESVDLLNRKVWFKLA